MLFWLQERFQVRGLSITSPFKKELPGSYGKSTIANTFLPAAQQFYNTDVMAFTAALKILNVSVSDSVLIYGTGACAELFVLHLQANGFGNISVSGRDISHVVEFCNALGVRTLSAHNTRFDLLVNCSPLGKSPTNDISKLPTFEKLIDLAYNASITKLVQLAQEQNIPYVDGSAFWELQFVPQFTLLIQL
jgi:shikimate 5-dehydrogenase